MAESKCYGGAATVSNPSHHFDSPCEIEQAIDCISSLPDAILQHILSYIPTKFAIRTSVLSKRWKLVWHETPSISIDFYEDCYGVDPSSIDKTLSSFTSPKITSLYLWASFDFTTPQVLDSWIELAITRNVESLTLSIPIKYSFQDSFFNNSSMKQLSLDFSCKTFPTCINVSWTSLRSLSLRHCKLSDESFANILAGCSMLESLMITYVDGLEHFDFSKSVNLTRLEIFGKGPVEIVAPQIRYLSLTLPSFCRDDTYNLVDVSSLTEAKLNAASNPHGYRTNGLDFVRNVLLKILTKLQNVEKLTIGTIVLQILSLAELRGVIFPQFEIKHLTVETKFYPSVIPGIVRLLQNSPELKKITIHTEKSITIPVMDLDKYLNAQRLNPDHCWSGKYEVFTKVDAKSKHVASFIELVLQEAKTLESMVLRLDGYLSATEFQKLLPMLPTVSSCNKKNVRDCGQGKAILNSFKITP